MLLLCLLLLTQWGETTRPLSQPPSPATPPQPLPQPGQVRALSANPMDPMVNHIHPIMQDISMNTGVMYTVTRSGICLLGAHQCAGLWQARLAGGATEGGQARRRSVPSDPRSLYIPPLFSRKDQVHD